MTEQVAGNIEAVAKTGKSFKLDNGEWYSVFNASQLEAGRGDHVEFRFKTNGKYKNVQGNVKGSSGGSVSTPNAKPVPSGGRTFPVAPLAPERTINRQNALTAAVNYHAHTDIASAEEVIATARKFEAYTTGDLDLQEETAALKALTE